jgi:formimidoylglutamate deiminase
MNGTLAIFAADALLPGGWARDVLLQWDARGQMRAVTTGSACPAGIGRTAGPVLPGMPNLHSHAFQRALAGLTEYRGAESDSFWTWRELMYRFALRISPRQLEDIATFLYIEMLEAGYTSVCEFHYLHHQGDGQPYADDATLSLCLVRAAASAGIGLTLLPVLYQGSGFGGLPPHRDQRRFIRSVDSILGLIERLRKDAIAIAPGTRIGIAPHSLRAVTPDNLHAALAGLRALDKSAPIHIHIAEQVQEVSDCLTWSASRPVDWLLDHADVNLNWCLVHATHMSPEEIRRMAASGAVAGLCPSTECNLGDGIFPAAAYASQGGRWGIGSDSHICVNAAEELMLLEYSQRLAARSRNVMVSAGQQHVATAMMLAAIAGGAQATGRPVAGLQVGQQADFVVMDAEHAALARLDAERMSATHVFASHRDNAVDEVWVAGKRRVEHGSHPARISALPGFLAARQALLND